MVWFKSCQPLGGDGLGIAFDQGIAFAGTGESGGSAGWGGLVVGVVWRPSMYGDGWREHGGLDCAGLDQLRLRPCKSSPSAPRRKRTAERSRNDPDPSPTAVENALSPSVKARSANR